MRVITGSAKGIELINLDSKTIPLSDRAKLALFNIISPKISGSNVLDVYAGTGSLGIEALSRGAKYSVFFDISSKASKSIIVNLKKTHLEHKAKVFRANVSKSLFTNIPENEKFDIIFLSPPYTKIVFHVINEAGAFLSESGILIFEHHKKDKFSQIENLQKIDDRTYGIVNFEIYKKI